MRKILAAIVVVTTATVISSSPLAQAPDEQQTAAPLRLPEPTTHKPKAEVPPFPVLPNTKVLTRKLMRSNRNVAAHQLTLSKHVVAFFENPAHEWLRAPRHDKCWEVPWQRSCVVARHSYRLHLTLMVAAKQKLYRELPLTNDWQTAVKIAQRAYPGTASWMLAISDREGGWSTWVWYGGRPWRGYHIGSDSTGDTVGGWMQFRWSTFAPYWRGAVKDLRKRGFLIPEMPMPAAGGDPQYAPWLNPLGQALTAGYMRYYGKDGCHWCLG